MTPPLVSETTPVPLVVTPLVPFSVPVRPSVPALTEVLRDLVARDPAISSRLAHLEKSFDLQRQLSNVDAIFDRVLG